MYEKYLNIIKYVVFFISVVTILTGLITLMEKSMVSLYIIFMGIGLLSLSLYLHTLTKKLKTKIFAAGALVSFALAFLVMSVHFYFENDIFMTAIAVICAILILLIFILVFAEKFKLPRHS